jgi:hypothetical protein
MTDEQHNKFIGIAFLVHGGFQMLILLVLMAFFSFIFSLPPTRPGDPGPPFAFFGVFFAVMFLFQLIFTAPSFIAAYALFKKKSWARIAAIVAGVLSSMHVPIGTAACVYALWFFFGENWKNVYPEVAASGSDRPQLQVGEESSHKASQEEFNFEYGRTTPPDWR